MKRNMLLPVQLFVVFIMMVSFAPARAECIYSHVDTFKVIDAWATPGQIVDVSIYLSNATPGLLGIIWGIVYENAHLTSIDLSIDSTRLEDLNWYIAFNDTLPGEVKFVGIDLYLQNLLQPGRGPIAFVSFQLDSGFTQGEIPIRFGDPPSDNNFNDFEGTCSIPVQADGYVRVCLEDSCPPVLNRIPGGRQRSVFPGDTLTFDVFGYDHDGDWVTISAADLPPNATFPTVEGAGSAAGTFAFAPDSTQVGNIYPVFFTIQDDGSPPRADADTVDITVTPGPKFVRGDVDANSGIDIYDGLLAIYWIGGDPDAYPPPCLDAADVSDDGIVDIFDGLQIIYWIGGDPAANPPAPPCCVVPDDCGFDPTPDDLGCQGYPPCD